MSLAIAAAVCAISWKVTEFAAATTALTAAAQQLAAAGRKPFLLVQVITHRLGVFISLKNQGGGPALVTTATYSLKQTTVHDTAASRNAHPSKFYGLLNLSIIQRTGQEPDADAGLASVLDLSDSSANQTCKQVAGELTVYCRPSAERRLPLQGFVFCFENARTAVCRVTKTS
jgi:hypothetical protein